MRAAYAALAIVAGYTTLGHRDAPVADAAVVVDASATASIRPAALPAFTNINRIAKADMIAPPPRAIAAGFVVTASLFAAPKEVAAEVHTAFLLPEAKPVEKPAVVAAAAVPPPAKPKPIVAAAVVPPPAAVAKPSAVAAPVLLAYAGPDAAVDIEKPFAAVMGDKAKNALLDPNIDDAHAWVNNPIPVDAKAASEVKCLATAIYFEARGESTEGQIAVAQVVLNRLKNPAYPKTICDVVYQNKNKRNRCQFSFACDGIADRINDKSAWTSSQALARRVLNDNRNLYLADVGASTHYHATYVKPRWARSMKRMDKIGRHVFYKTKNGGWS
ncbi:MAG TPA: cell wall hydrolase [Bauldia sp.]|nr:cell wall hydrolase [Bauldia sp.]